MAAVGPAGLIALRLHDDPKSGRTELLRRGAITYPVGSEVCSGPMAPACAHEAAVRAGNPLAWLASPMGFTTDGVHLLTIKGGSGNRTNGQ